MNKNNLEMLLDNFRLSEAIGYISALVNVNKVSTVRGDACERLIRAYEQVVCNSLWDEEGLLILSSCKIDDALCKDISAERDRLISLINEWKIGEKRLILYFVSAYYAVANIDGMRMEKYIDKIIKEIKDDGIKSRVSMAIGGYEKFQAVGNALEKYYNLNESIFEVVKDIVIKVQPYEIKQ